MTRARNAPACIAEIETTFLTRSLADWRTRLEGFTGVWAAALTPAEVHEHVQVEANGYLPELTSQEGAKFRLPAPPMQFGGEAAAPRGPAPSSASTPRRSCLSSAATGTPSPSSVTRGRLAGAPDWAAEAPGGSADLGSLIR